MKKRDNEDELTIFMKWYELLKWTLNTTEKFPKKVRFTFSGRIDNLGLDVLEGIVEARYSKNKKEILKKINLDLEKMRILMRMCHDMKYISTRGYEHFSRSIDEVGRMNGGWLKQREAEEIA